jgi:hypothetical protein
VPRVVAFASLGLDIALVAVGLYCAAAVGMYAWLIGLVAQRHRLLRRSGRTTVARVAHRYTDEEIIEPAVTSRAPDRDVPGEELALVACPGLP